MSFPKVGSRPWRDRRDGGTIIGPLAARAPPRRRKADAHAPVGCVAKPAPRHGRHAGRGAGLLDQDQRLGRKLLDDPMPVAAGRRRPLADGTGPLQALRGLERFKTTPQSAATPVRSRSPDPAT